MAVLSSRVAGCFASAIGSFAKVIDSFVPGRCGAVARPHAAGAVTRPRQRPRRAAGRRPTGAVVVVLLTLATTVVRAEEVPAPDVLVRGRADAIMAAVAANRELYAMDPAPLRREIRAILADHVAFERIARGVMGRHGEGATPIEADRFAEVFTDALMDRCAARLVTLEVERIEVRPAELQREDRARVTMAVTTTDGRGSTLLYSMALGEAGWEVRNLFLDGDDLGLGFRDRFDALMREHEGSVTAVVEAWAAAGEGG